MNTHLNKFSTEQIALELKRRRDCIARLTAARNRVQAKLRQVDQKIRAATAGTAGDEPTRSVHAPAAHKPRRPRRSTASAEAPI